MLLGCLELSWCTFETEGFEGFNVGSSSGMPDGTTFDAGCNEVGPVDGFIEVEITLGAGELVVKDCWSEGTALDGELTLGELF